jgi:hypothetical protein
MPHRPQRFEHGIDPEELGSPRAAAAASYAGFALGGAVPLVRFTELTDWSVAHVRHWRCHA